MTTNGRIFQAGAVTRGSLIVATLAASLLGTGAARADECKDYALASAKQMQRNVSKACGLKGDGWSIKQEVHFAFCTSVAPEEWRKAEEEREAQLKKCGA